MSDFAVEKVYIDTNILINYSLGREKVSREEQFIVAKKVFDDAINGDYKIAISYFLLSETLHALRNIVTRSAFREQGIRLNQSQLIRLANSQEFQKKVTEESWKAFRNIIEKLTRDTKHFVIESEQQPYAGMMFQQGLGIMTTTFGTFRVYRYRCKICDEYINCCHCRSICEIAYKAVNAPDLTHIFIAQTLGCNRFFTMDKYFARIAEKSPISIEVLSA